MATGLLSLPRNNSLQALRELVEDKKREVRDNFLELRTLLQQCEDSVAGRLDRIYSDTRNNVESSERTIQQMEEAKKPLQATIVDNKMNLFVQTTIQAIDAQIAEVRNSTALVPIQIQLQWRREAVKQSIQTFCNVVSPSDGTSCDAEAQEPLPQTAKNFETEAQLLKKEHTAEKEDLLKREEKHKQTISLLKARVADKEKQLSFKDEKITTLEEEMGRFSEKSHEVFDKYTEDKSKFSEAEAQLAAVRKEVEQQKHLVANLQRGKEELEDKNAILVKQQLQLESEITTLKYQLESLSGHTSLERNELQKKHRDTSAQPISREGHINSLKSRIAELETELLRKQRSIEQLSQGTANSDYEGMRQKYCQIENELKQLKLKMSKRGATTSPDSFVSDTQTRVAASGTAARCSKVLQEEIEDLKIDLTLKTGECEDLKKTCSSLRKELKSAEDLLASKLDVASQFEATESERDVSGLSVSQSLGAEFMGRNLSYNNTTQQPTGQAMWRQHSDTTDADRIRQLEKQLSEKSNNLQALKAFSEQKMTENNILRENLDLSQRELDRTKLELAKLSAQTHDISVQGQPPKAAVTPVQHKYKLTKLFVDGESSDCYTLNQAEKPEALIGELAFCKPLGCIKYVIGTIKCILPGRYKYDKTIAGIEFLDPHGDSNGEYKGDRYFHAEYKHAIFLPVNEVYILYHYPTK